MSNISCTFCKILKKEYSSSVLFENEYTLAFLDIHPINDGHTLIVPKRHVESLTDLTQNECAELMKTGVLIASYLKQSLPECQGVNLSLADGVLAGQEVPHVHLHVIPRKIDDGFGWKFPPNYSEVATERNVLDRIAEKIKNSIYS